MLTQSQVETLNGTMLADPAASALGLAGDDVGLAAWFNSASSTVLWRTDVPVQDIFEGVIWANMTPAAVPDGTTLWTNRNLQCQSKQLALQTMLVGRDVLNATKANIRSGLQDSLTALPSKVDGSTQPAGWLVVVETLKRIATIAEAALSTGAGTSAAPAVPTFEGMLTYADASLIRS